MGLWASTAARKQRAIDAFYEALFAKKKKRRKPTHLNPVGVHKHIHTHTHISPALFYTSEIQCVILHVDAHLHTHKCVCVCVSFHPTFVLRLGCGVL